MEICEIWHLVQDINFCIQLGQLVLTLMYMSVMRVCGLLCVHDNWTVADATVVCRELGMAQGYVAV